MYNDFKGTIVVATVDHCTTIEKYAEAYGIDTSKYQVLEIKVDATRDIVSIDNPYPFKVASNAFVCKDKNTGEIVKSSFVPKTSVFNEFCKQMEFTIKNNE